MAKEITLTPAGGNFYRAMIYHWLVTISTLPVVIFFLLLAVLNPLWFRQLFFNFVERKINQFVAWRDKIKYKIYLGTDPDVWHALKD